MFVVVILYAYENGCKEVFGPFKTKEEAYSFVQKYDDKGVYDLWVYELVNPGG